MKQAPEYPTTEQLQESYPYDDHAGKLHDKRWRVSQILAGHTAGLVAIVGPCAMTEKTENHEFEAAEVAKLEETDDSIASIYRAPVWKPRSNPKDWHGLETTMPETAYAALQKITQEHAHAAIELGLPYHVGRYASMLAFGWIGSRNADKAEYINRTARQTPNMPLGIKNAMDGSIDDALLRVENARTDSNAPAVLIFRGGEALRNPMLWEEMYRYAHDQTGGNMIVDVAHGSEMAHDTTGRFQKTVAGQKAALEHVIQLAQSGYAPKGVMIEAGIGKSPTDPIMPLDVALNGVRELAHIIRSNQQNVGTEVDALRIPVAT